MKEGQLWVRNDGQLCVIKGFNDTIVRYAYDASKPHNCNKIKSFLKNHKPYKEIRQYLTR